MKMTRKTMWNTIPPKTTESMITTVKTANWSTTRDQGENHHRLSLSGAEDTEKDLHTELTGLANECHVVRRWPQFPESVSRSMLWKVRLEAIGIAVRTLAELRRYRRRRVMDYEPHEFTESGATACAESAA